jgi:predicted transcriptional regulator
MDAVWRQGEVSVREIMDGLNASSGRSRAYTTYMTILSRLDHKGLLVRRRDGRTDLYRAVYDREQYEDLRAQAEVESVVEQFGDLALAHIARQMSELGPDRRRELERLARRR